MTVMTIDDVARIELPWRSYWYLASAYTKHPRGHEAAFREAAWIANRLMRRGVVVVSPVVHSHPIAQAGGLDATDHALWMTMDLPLLRAAYGILVATTDGWKESRGIGEEVAEAKSLGKSVIYLKAPT